MRIPIPPLVLAAAASCSLLAACSSVDRVSEGIAGRITPYRIEIVQGNFVSKEQVAALKEGMSRQQVRDILGTPLVTDAFHKDRWDYVFTLRRQGVPRQERHFTAFFRGDLLARWEGDEMPSEADFVATLANKRRGASVPELEASEDKLKRFAQENKPVPAAPEPAPAPVTANYPPLEAPQR